MRVVLLALLLAACSSSVATPTAPPRTSTTTSKPAASTTRPRSASPACMTVADPDDGDPAPSPVDLEGEVVRGQPSGDGTAPPLLLRLREPRCAVVHGRTLTVTSVMLASTGVDLRTFLERPARVTGPALPATNELLGLAVVVIVESIERVVEVDDTPER